MTELDHHYELLIGQRLRGWRRRKGWPLKRVAHELDVSVPTVSDWENGARFPSGQHLLKLAVLYDTPVCHLLCAGVKLCPTYRSLMQSNGGAPPCPPCAS